jgi:hypothetical protein
VFVRDRKEGLTVRVSVGRNGEQANADSTYCAITGDGRLVAFHSAASNLAPGDDGERHDVFLRDLQQGKTLLISATPAGAPGNGDSEGPAISSDGTHVAFVSTATDLVEDAADGAGGAFMCRLALGRPRRVGCGGSCPD